jgi:hypothetical protein
MKELAMDDLNQMVASWIELYFHDPYTANKTDM